MSLLGRSSELLTQHGSSVVTETMAIVTFDLFRSGSKIPIFVLVATHSSPNQQRKEEKQETANAMATFEFTNHGIERHCSDSEASDFPL